MTLELEVNLFENDHALFEECSYRIVNENKSRVFLTVYESFNSWNGYFSLVPAVETLSDENKLKIMELDELEANEITEMDILHQLPELIIKESEPFYICKDLLEKEVDSLELVNSFENEFKKFLNS